MTTFMARLLFKLTEMSCNLANQYITSQNQFCKDLRNAARSEGFRDSQINEEFPLQELHRFTLTDEDMLHFENNTQLLTDDSISVPSLVQ